MKERVAEMEREAQKLRELQDAANKQSAGGISTSGSSEDPGAPMEGTEDDKMVSDSRSIYVGNVRAIVYLSLSSPTDIHIPYV